jgi:hypothetical protein
MSTSDDQNSGQHEDPHTEVEAAQHDADAAPVSDDREPPAPDEDRNP